MPEAQGRSLAERQLLRRLQLQGHRLGGLSQPVATGREVTASDFPLLWPRGGAVAPCLCQVGLPASYRLWEKALLAFTLKGTQIHPSLGSLALGFAGTTWKELVL